MLFTRAIIRYYILTDGIMDLLIADDDEASSLILELALRQLHHSAMTVKTGADVLSLLQDLEFDGVILDIEMPVMSGTETLERIRSNPKFQPLPVYAITAHSDGPQIESIRRAGFSGYISKPFKLGDLATTLNGCDSSGGNSGDSALPLVDQDVFACYAQLLRSAGMDVEGRVHRTLDSVSEWLDTPPGWGAQSKDAAHFLAGSCAVIGASALRGELRELERVSMAISGEELWAKTLAAARRTLQETKHVYRKLLSGFVDPGSG